MQYNQQTHGNAKEIEEFPLRMAGDYGTVQETEIYFQVGEGHPNIYGKTPDQILVDAREWNFEQFKKALETDRSPIVVDRGNGLTLETCQYVQLAMNKGCQMAFMEPDSEWLQEFRALLQYKQNNWSVLKNWAERLAQLNKKSHFVPADKILQLMEAWQDGITIQGVILFGESYERNR